MLSLRKSFECELGLIFYFTIILLGGFHSLYPDGTLRLEMTHVLITQGTVLTQQGPINYAPLQSILMIPTYALGYFYGTLTHTSLRQAYIFGNLTNFHLFLPIIISMLCVLYFKVLGEMGIAKSIRVLSTFVLFWGTFLMAYTKGMFSEPLNALLMLSSFYYFIKSRSGNYARNNRKNFFFASLLILNNFIFILYAGLMVAYVVWGSWVQRKKHSEARRVALEGSLFISINVALFLFYNFLRYGQIFNFGYQGEGFTTNELVGLYGLLLSFGKGLAIFSPITFLCIFFFLFKYGEMEPWQKYFFSTVLISFTCFLLLYSKWNSWPGGHCWGPRFLLPFVPMLHLLFPLMWSDRSSGNMVFRTGVILAVVWGIAINFLNYVNPLAPYAVGNFEIQNYGQKMFIPEKSIVFEVWNTGDISGNLWMFLGILILSASLLWYGNNGHRLSQQT